MKKIEAIIPSRKFNELEAALRGFGISGMTVTEVKGYGNQQTRPESYLLLPKTKIEIFTSDDQADSIVDTIIKASYTGQAGDGKIALYEIQDLIRIRTTDRGEVTI